MTVRVVTGDSRLELRKLPDKSVHCVVTSPPYFGLRDYGTGTWSGGDPVCDHVVGELRRGLGLANSPANTRGGAVKCAEVEPIKARAQCPKCGALRTDSQIGLEPSPQAFVAEMVALFAEVHRVLRDDGTLWLNMGDSYAGSGKGRNGDGTHSVGGKQDTNRGSCEGIIGAKPETGLKAKDLIGIPWRLAFALQDAGWYLRQDIVWSKPNPMPESVEDRCTKSHEYLFLLTKSETYFFDQFAVLEPASPSTHARMAQDLANQAGSAKANGGTRAARPFKPVGTKVAPANSGIKNNESFHAAMAIMPSVRNMRSVWAIATQSFSGEFCRACQTYFEGKRLAALRVEKITDAAGRTFRRRWCECGLHDAWVAHFATFPPKLVEPCIKAGTSEHGCCATCGAPWERVLERTDTPRADFCGSTFDEGKTAAHHEQSGSAPQEGERFLKRSVGFAPTCTCPQTKAVPCTVLDPFGGAGTSALVADRLGRDAVLLELNPDYAEMARQRIAGDQPGSPLEAAAAMPQVQAELLPLFAVAAA